MIGRALEDDSHERLKDHRRIQVDRASFDPGFDTHAVPILIGSTALDSTSCGRYVLMPENYVWQAVIHRVIASALQQRRTHSRGCHPIEHANRYEVLGRDSANDADAISEIAIWNADPDEVAHAVEDQADLLFT